MFDFLSQPTVVLVSGIVFFLIFLVTFLRVGAAITGERRPSGTLTFLAGTFFLGLVAALVLTMKYGYGETMAMAYALYGIVFGVGPLFLLWKVVQVCLFSHRGMQEAYRMYDEYQRQGKRPCLVMTAFGARVIEAYPPHMETGLISWAEGGVIHAYETTTPERLEAAIRCG